MVDAVRCREYAGYMMYAHAPRPTSRHAVLATALLAAGCTPDNGLTTLFPEIVVSPANMDFGDVVVDYSGTMDLEIKNTGRAPLTISDIRFDGPSVRAFSVGDFQAEVAAGDTLSVPISFTPPTYLAYTDTLLVESDDSENPQVVVRLFGEGVDGEKPDIALSSSSMDFGTVSMGESVPLFFSVSNEGEGDLVIEGAELSGAGKDKFGLLYPLAGQTLTGGATFSTAIIYTPTEESGDNATLTITSNDPDEGSVDVVLLANGGGDYEYPIAVLDCPTDVAPLETVRFDASDSYDPNGDDPLFYVWDVVEYPSGSSYDFTADDDGATMLVDIAGSYQVKMFVMNAIGLISEPAYCVMDAIPSDKIHVELIWNTGNSDLDLHLVRSGGAVFSDEDDVCYCNPAPNWGETLSSSDDPRLDLDDMYGYGPENINIEEPADDTYDVYVHYFLDNGGGYTTATVRFYLDGSLVEETSALMEGRDLWKVGTITWPDATVTLTGEDPARTTERTCKED